MKETHVMRYAEQFSSAAHAENLFETRVETTSRLHWHDYYEMELVFAGAGTQWINNRPLRLAPGSLYLLTPLDMHQIEVEAPLSLISVKLLLSDLNAAQQTLLRTAAAAITARVDGETLAALLGLYRQTIASIRDHAETGALFSHAFMSYLLGALFRFAGCRLPTGRKAERQVEDALAYIRAHCRQPLSLAEVAGQVGLSRNHFCTVFGRVAGCPYAEYLARCRVQQARDLLASTDDSITQVALAAGFDSLSHFFRVFKSVTGITPRQFRLQLTA